MPSPIPLSLRMQLLKGTPLLFEHQGRWHAIFYDRERRRRKWHSLGTSKKEVARLRYRQIVRAYEEGEFNPFTDRYEFQSLTVGEAARRFMVSRGPKWTPATKNDYRKFLSLLEKSVPPGMALLHLSHADCLAMVSRPGSQAGQKGYYRRLSSFLNWCVQKKYISDSPLSDVHEPRGDKKPVEYFTRDEHARIVRLIEKDAAANKGRSHTLRRLALIVRFAVSTGMRLKELQDAKWRDVDQGAERINVLGKGGKRRVIPLFDRARDVIREIELHHMTQFGTSPPREMPIFDGMPYHDTSRDFKHYVRESGLGEEYTFHSLRKTFASWLVMDNVDIFRVSTWLGHSSVVITQKTYAHLTPGYVPNEAKGTFSSGKVGIVLALRKEQAKRRRQIVRRKSLNNI